VRRPGIVISTERNRFVISAASNRIVISTGAVPRKRIGAVERSASPLAT
jgi:hypothetical protein